ncbi:unnamed protein product [Bursaphelenchus xylophilus]|uniref:(pine wood nematode) hypothetical protein n=1 Tax=Bursaphelenchus xylophilus TaxID=6326 RepID=A0A1I7RJ98_BURXY|nr:unnamed protein product [Bursaphelenchus xylophilus]CAG9119495.1 unnamed protein product [Bursaphelenchus xylophilus]
MEQVPQLNYLALRFIGLHLFNANARWRQTRDIRRDVFDALKKLKITLANKKAILASFDRILKEVERWDSKHSKLFVEDNVKIKPTKIAKSNAKRSDHLRMYHGSLIWKNNLYCIDDNKTAQTLIYKDLLNWPQLRFQFACFYAVENLLTNDFVFDKVRRKVFRQRLGEHCVYDLWLRVLDDKKAWKKIYQEDRLLVDQVCVQALHYAMKNGFIELTKFLWTKLTGPQKETIGFLAWKSVCIRMNNPELIRFLCSELCALNLRSMTVLTWDNFYIKVREVLENEDITSQLYVDYYNRLELFLNNICSELKSALLCRDGCRVIADAFWYQNEDAFALLTEHIEKDKIKEAREVVDRIYDKKRTKSMKKLRNRVVQRQATIQ